MLLAHYSVFQLTLSISLVPLKHPQPIHTAIPRSLRPASSTSPVHGNSPLPLSNPAGFPLRHIPFQPAVSCQFPRATVLYAHIPVPPGIAAMCSVHRHGQSISGNRTGFSLSFPSVFSHGAWSTFATLENSTVSRPCEG